MGLEEVHGVVMANDMTVIFGREYRCLFKKRGLVVETLLVDFFSFKFAIVFSQNISRASLK